MIDSNDPTPILDRYALFDAIAQGGMATVHIGRQVGAAGFSKIVAIKRMHPHLATNEQFVNMFVDEARLAGRLHHPNVVNVVDVVAHDGEAFLVMEYVHGQSFSALMRAADRDKVPLPIALAVQIVHGTLEGLHAAHNATDHKGEPLRLVHRDISPQNILVGVDGISRVLDFGIAKAVGRLSDSTTGQVKGKAAYMAPEQVVGKPVDQRTDIYAAGVVLWEALAQRRLFTGENSVEVVYRVLNDEIPRLSSVVPGIAPELEDAVEKATQKDAEQRFSSAQEFAQALEGCTPVLPARVLGAWVRERGGTALAELEERVRRIEALDLEMGSGQGVAPLTRFSSESRLAPPLIRAGSNEVTLTNKATLTNEGRSPRDGSSTEGDLATVVVQPVTSSTSHSGLSERGQGRAIAVGLAILGAGGLAVILLALALSGGEPDAGERPPGTVSPEDVSQTESSKESSSAHAEMKREVSALAKAEPADPPADRDNSVKDGDGEESVDRGSGGLTQTAPPASKPRAGPKPRPTPSQVEPRAEDLFSRE